MIRAYSPDDLEIARKIHERFYKHEFDLSDFLSNFNCVFTIEDNRRNIVTIGGVRPIAEVVAITNKDASVRERRDALIKLLQASLFTANSFNYDQLHVFIQDEKWLKHLLKFGFRYTKGRALVHDV